MLSVFFPQQLLVTARPHSSQSKEQLQQVQTKFAVINHSSIYVQLILPGKTFCPSAGWLRAGNT